RMPVDVRTMESGHASTEEGREARERVMWLGERARIGWLAGAIVTAALTGAPITYGQAAATPKPVAAAPSAANKAKNVDALLQQGIEALSAGQYQPAREAFQDVVTLDPRNARAHHGLALCMMAQKEIA